jgi:hypothetical protein
MAVDRQGLRLTGPVEAAAAYDRATAHLVRFQAEVVDTAAAAGAGSAATWPGPGPCSAAFPSITRKISWRCPSATWHYALYLLQADDVPGALAVYDTFLHNRASEDVALELLDATALLWRLHLEGTAVGDRSPPLADAWTRVIKPGFYTFNDMHAIMAYLGAGRPDQAGAVVTALEQVTSEGDRHTTGWEMTTAVGLPVCRSLLYFGTGRYAAAVDELLPVRTRVHEFGGSHAQRDAVERTLLEAAIRAGRHELASALVSERLANRAGCTYAWSKRALLLSRDGAAAAAAAAAARQRELAAGIQAAVAAP